MKQGQGWNIGDFSRAQAILVSLLAGSAAQADPPATIPPGSVSPTTAIPTRNDPQRIFDPGANQRTILPPAATPERLPGDLEGLPIPNPTPVTVAPPASPGIDTTLIPGRKIEPIDLISTLRLAGERDLDIAIARQRVSQSLADLDRAPLLWLPSLFLGPTYYRTDGQVQTATGPVQNVNRNSLFLGSSAALANGFPAPSPGTGYPQLNGLSSVLRLSDAIFLPLAARRDVAANQRRSPEQDERRPPGSSRSLSRPPTGERPSGDRA